MNEIQTFNFEKEKVRTFIINNQPFFVAKDVAEIIGTAIRIKLFEKR